VPLSGGSTTLTWTAPAGCIVYVEKWKPGLSVQSIFKPVTYFFLNNDSVTVPIAQQSTFYVSAQKGTGAADMVLWAKTLDVIPQ
jgi:hypothetical protein